MLIIMQIAMLFGLAGLMNTNLLLKLSQSQMDHEVLHLNALHFLNNLEMNGYITQSPCVFNSAALPNVLTLSASWRMQNGCSDHLDGFRYDYVLEALGEDACATFAAFNDKNVVAAYYRITVWAQQTSSPDAVIILQSTIIMPVTRTRTCDESMHVVIPGRQMWRELA